MQELGPELAHPRYGNYVLDQGEEIVLYHLSGRRARAATSTSAAAAAEGSRPRVHWTMPCWSLW